MDTNMNYESPEIEIIEVVVEAGFAISVDTEQGGGTEIGRANKPSQTKVVVF